MCKPALATCEDVRQGRKTKILFSYGKRVGGWPSLDGDAGLFYSTPPDLGDTQVVGLDAERCRGFWRGEPAGLQHP
jgi:hypothetical protein